MFEVQLTFWQWLWLVIGLIVIVWGLIYASTLLVSAVWVLFIAAIILAVFLIGKRGYRRVIRGGRR